MNKSELIESVAKTAGISKATAGDALDATLSAIKVALKKEQSVTLVGFGTFKVGKRAARTGRNPRTCLLYTSPSPRDAHESRMPSSA